MVTAHPFSLVQLNKRLKSFLIVQSPFVGALIPIKREGIQYRIFNESYQMQNFLLTKRYKIEMVEKSRSMSKLKNN